MAKILIHGKEYTPVIDRVNDLHNKFKELSIETNLTSLVEGLCIIKATITTPKGVYTGYACEKEGSSMINKTSFLENCETSAIGRAAAAAGFGGSEYASANEVENAIHQQKSEKSVQKKTVLTKASPGHIFSSSSKAPVKEVTNGTTT